MAEFDFTKRYPFGQPQTESDQRPATHQEEPVFDFTKRAKFKPTPPLLPVTQPTAQVQQSSTSSLPYSTKTKQRTSGKSVFQRMKGWVQKGENEAHREMVRLWNEKKAFAAMKGEDLSRVAPPDIPDHLRAKMSKQNQHYWDDAIRRWGTDEPYRPLYEPILPGKAGQFEERAMARAQQMLDPTWVKEEDMPSTDSTLLDVAADLFGTVAGFSVPIGAGGQTIQLGRAAATSPTAAKVLSRVPTKATTHAARALEGAVGGAAYGAYRAGVEDLSPKEAAKMIVSETALWAAGDVTFRGLLEDVLPKALQYIKVQGQRYLKRNPEASFEDVQKSLVQDMGMEWDSLDASQKARVAELTNRAIEGKTVTDQPLALSEARQAEQPSALADEPPLQFHKTIEAPETKLLSETVSSKDIDERLSIDREAVNAFVDQALGRPDKKFKTLSLRKVTPDEAKRIKELTGMDVSGYTHIINNYDLRHAIKQHGNAVIEANRGQLPITVEDLKAIPEVINSPDKILLGTGKSIIYRKQVNGVIYYVEVTSKRKGVLNSKTMWKKPSMADHGFPKETPHYTSETEPGLTSSTKDIIRQAATDVNSEFPEVCVKYK